MSSSRCRIALVPLLVALAAPAVVPLAAQRGRAEVNRRDLLNRPVDARVVRVADADTLEAVVRGETRPIRIRLQGIDAPEQGEVFSREATARLRILTLDRTVRVAGTDIDRYGRLVARVAVGGADVSRDLVRAGLACHAYAYDEMLARDEATARAAGAGFWSAANKPACVTRTAFSARTPRSPADREPRATPRRQAPTDRAAAAGPFRANVTSGVYHSASCPNYTCRNCTRSFATQAEAKAAGFRPAADCLRR